jgi:hypothetical protein
MLQFIFRGLQELIELTRRAAESLLNLRAANDQMALAVLEVIRRNFEDGGPPGETWEHWAAGTREMIGAGIGPYTSGGKNRILISSGRMLQDITTPGRVVRITATGKDVKLSFMHPWYFAHHFGASISRSGGSGRTFRFYSASGDLVFTDSIGPAHITIPKRPFYTDRQLIEVLATTFQGHITSNRSIFGWLSDVFARIKPTISSR